MGSKTHTETAESSGKQVPQLSPGDIAVVEDGSHTLKVWLDSDYEGETVMDRMVNKYKGELYLIGSVEEATGQYSQHEGKDVFEVKLRNVKRIE
jgi:hypothetical protein